MSGAQALLALDVVPDSIWGDEDETIVYAQVLGKGRAVIFRFRLDDSSQSLPSRIVNYYHGNDESSTQCGFKDRDTMRSTIWSTIATVWPGCGDQPSIFEPGTVVDLVSDGGGGVTWNAYQEPLFEQYLDLFHGIQPSDLMPQGVQPAPSVDISQVVILSAMGGKGCSKRVQVQTGQEGHAGLLTTFAFKGVDFQTYLQVHDDDDEFARATVETWYQSSKLIASLPKHPRIQPPPKMLVSVRGTVIGHLSTFCSKGDLAAIIESANSTGTAISLRQKAQWAFQISQAIAHTHNVMHTFHMDIKPGNFLVDDNDNLTLIDWEQSGAPATTLAPEADGTWDVEDVDDVHSRVSQRAASSKKLVYTKYDGPERRNMPEGSGQQPFHIWNVFPMWQASCPKATELAEVFALGRTVWMLLTQTIDGFEEISHPNDVQIMWENADSCPSSWIELAMQCMDNDPNKRPLLVDVVEFWEAECLILQH